jgi:hypothetical protein
VRENLFFSSLLELALRVLKGCNANDPDPWDIEQLLQYASPEDGGLRLDQIAYNVVRRQIRLLQGREKFRRATRRLRTVAHSRPLQCRVQIESAGGPAVVQQAEAIFNELKMQTDWRQ